MRGSPIVLGFLPACTGGMYSAGTGPRHIQISGSGTLILQVETVQQQGLGCKDC